MGFPCHCFRTTSLPYRFLIIETSATALCGTPGKLQYSETPSCLSCPTNVSSMHDDYSKRIEYYHDLQSSTNRPSAATTQIAYFNTTESLWGRYARPAASKSSQGCKQSQHGWNIFAAQMSRCGVSAVISDWMWQLGTLGVPISISKFWCPKACHWHPS